MTRELDLADLTADRIEYGDADLVGHQLINARRRLITIIRDCVVDNKIADLEALRDGSLAVHTMLKVIAEHPTRMPDLTDAPFRPREGALIHATRALASLGLTLIADQEQAGRHLSVFRRWATRAGLEVPAEPITRISAAVATPHAATLRHLANGGELDLLSLVWLIALDSGRGTGFALPVRRGPSTEVLLDLGSQGKRAVLRLSRVPALPSGLVPDPASMALSSADSRFHAALGTAWQEAGGTSRDAVLWSLTDPAGPITRVTQESLSLAFAVLLDEQRRLAKPFLGPLTVRRLQSRIAIVGQLDPDQPAATASVSGYDTKLAVVGSDMRVILPEADHATARKENSRAELVPAATWRAAAVAGRRIDRRRLLAVTAVIALILATGTFALYRVSESHRDADSRRATASDLAARAVSLRRADPTLAAKLGLAAYRIDPGSRGVDAMRDVLSDNRNVLRTWQADSSRVSALTLSQALDVVVTSGGEQVSRVWALSTGELKGEIPKQASDLVIAGEHPLVAAWTDTGLALFDVTAPPTELGAFPEASCTKSKSLVTMGFSHSDAALVAVWRDGAISTYDVVTRQPTACLSAADAMTPLDYAMKLHQEKVVAADIVDPGFAGRSDDEVVMVLADNSVISVRTGSRDARIEVPKEKTTGNAALVAATPHHISVATPSGVVVWRRADQVQVSNPAGGLGFQPRVLAASNGRLLFAGETGTVAIPADRPDYVLAASLEQLNGGAATVAAMSGRAIVAGGPGGRISVIGDSSGQLALAQRVTVTSTAFLSDGRLVGAEAPSSEGRAANTTWSTAVVLVDPNAPVPQKVDGQESEPDRWRLTKRSDRFYANDVAVSSNFVAAAGQVNVQGGGTVLVWPWHERVIPRQLTLPDSDKGKKRPEERLIARVAFTPDGNLLVARHISGEVGVWSTDNWELLGRFHLKPGNTDMEIPSTHGFFLEGEPEECQLVEVDLTTREVVRREPAELVERLSVSADGSRVLTMTSEGVVQLRGADLSPVGDSWRLAVSGDAPVAFAMDEAGSRVAVSQGDRVTIYDLATQTMAMPPMRVDGSLVVRVTWSPNSELLAVTAMPPVRGNKQVDVLRLFRISGLDWTSQVCRWAGGGLDRTDWSRYVGVAVTYIDLCSEDAR
ncbi:hypothetical protein [Alloactinosynnema sp. L-07]|uniref:hypothetical protein n=1 Tax=Alloactinosynnema sp. L-07 TaxID=1653480 RepID=UPI00065EF803|nr:hypothetical protein [Alloactinosynnema sp. L-07]CRK59325.1 hypothetical protein [Alloactinosynnema sp. L-07]